MTYETLLSWSGIDGNLNSYLEEAFIAQRKGKTERHFGGHDLSRAIRNVSAVMLGVRLLGISSKESILDSALLTESHDYCSESLGFIPGRDALHFRPGGELLRLDRDEFREHTVWDLVILHSRLDAHLGSTHPLREIYSNPTLRTTLRGGPGLAAYREMPVQSEIFRFVLLCEEIFEHAPELEALAPTARRMCSQHFISFFCRDVSDEVVIRRTEGMLRDAWTKWGDAGVNGVRTGLGFLLEGLGSEMRRPGPRVRPRPERRPRERGPEKPTFDDDDGPSFESRGR